MKSPERLHRLQLQMRQQTSVGHRGRGRPRLAIAPELVFELALLGLNNTQIAARLPCDRKTLARFRTELVRARARRAVVSKLAEFAGVLAGEPHALLRAYRWRLQPDAKPD